MGQGRNTTDGFKAFHLLRGRGVEIGALSSPFDLDAEVLYADTKPAEEMARELANNEGRTYLARELVKVDILLQPPFYNFRDYDPNSFDFCASSHVVEHHPNPVYFILEQFRIVKPGGHVYMKLPNRAATYDRRRLATPAAYLEQKYINFDFSDEPQRALDLVLNTTGHEDYKGQGEEMAQRLVAERDGHHHFHVFDPASVLDLVAALKRHQSFALVYFSLEGVNIHVAMRKQS